MMSVKKAVLLTCLFATVLASGCTIPQFSEPEGPQPEILNSETDEIGVHEIVDQEVRVEVENNGASGLVGVAVNFRDESGNMINATGSQPVQMDEGETHTFYIDVDVPENADTHSLTASAIQRQQ